MRNLHAWLEPITAGLRKRRVPDETASMSGGQRLCAAAAGLTARGKYAEAADTRDIGDGAPGPGGDTPPCVEWCRGMMKWGEPAARRPLPDGHILHACGLGR